eukprot:TRINITY_DN352_c1_g1_i4.p1 TRINITY_DN352_c1_g1~~TRINITY_DN352_c1_g1_i4.p1  ORF type:complete len:159 (-),score=12.90 TRINITY_DN352_c1_g1_i4:51-527(-)
MLRRACKKLFATSLPFTSSRSASLLSKVGKGGESSGLTLEEYRERLNRPLSETLADIDFTEVLTEKSVWADVYEARVKFLMAEKFGVVDPEKQKEMYDGFVFSRGYFSLEHCWDGGHPPLHTYEELPIIKELDDVEPPEYPWGMTAEDFEQARKQLGS